MPVEALRLDGPARAYQWKKPTTAAVQADLVRSSNMVPVILVCFHLHFIMHEFVPLLLPYNCKNFIRVAFLTAYKLLTERHAELCLALTHNILMSDLTLALHARLHMQFEHGVPHCFDLRGHTYICNQFLLKRLV